MVAQLLAQRMVCHCRLQLVDEAGVAAQSQVDLETPVPCAEPALLEPVTLALTQQVRVDVGERGAAPQGQAGP
jgi:hypothetical protein